MPLQRIRMNFSSNGNVPSNYVLTPKALVQPASRQPMQLGNGLNSMFERLKINTTGGGGCGCGK